MLNMPTVTNLPPKPPEKPHFMVNKGNFRSFFRDMFMTFQKVLPPTINNMQCNLWRQWQNTEGVHVNITWSTVVKLVSGNQAEIFHQSMSTSEVFDRLIELFPILTEYYEFHQTGDKMNTIQIFKTNAPLKPITSYIIPDKSMTLDNDTGTWTKVTVGNKPTTSPIPPSTPIAILDDNNFKLLDTVLDRSHELEIYDKVDIDTSDEHSKFNKAIDDIIPAGSDSTNAGLSSVSSIRQFRTPVPLKNIPTIERLVAHGEPDKCTVSELAMYIEHEAKYVSSKTGFIQAAVDDSYQTEQRTYQVYQDTKKITTQLVQQQERITDIIDRKCNDKLKECNESIVGTYKETIKDIENFKSDIENAQKVLKDKISIAVNMGNYAEATEQHFKMKLDEYTKEQLIAIEKRLQDANPLPATMATTVTTSNAAHDVIQLLDGKLQEFHATTTTLEAKIQTYKNEVDSHTKIMKEHYKEHAHSTFNDYKQLYEDHLATKMNTSLSMYKETFDMEIKQIVQEKLNEIKTFQPRLEHPIPPSQHINDTSTITTDHGATTEQIHEKCQQHQPTDDDNGFFPKLKKMSLVDYKRGFQTMVNCRVIDTKVEIDGTYTYTVITENNNIIHDLRYQYMTNIRQPPQNISANPELSTPVPMQTYSQQVERPRQSSKRRHGHLNRPQRNPYMNTSIDDDSNDSIDVFNLNQYRYPKHSNTLSSVHFTHVTKNGAKWNLELSSEDNIKPWYDKTVNCLSEAGILLRDWKDIEKGKSIALITPENCDNYEHAYNRMATAIFNYLDQNQGKIFTTYTIPIGYIEGYRATADGFKVITSILEDKHPKLIDPILGDDDPVRPTLETCPSLYVFCNKLKDYYDYLYDGATRRVDHNRRVLKYIQTQLTDEYKDMDAYITSQLEDIYKDPHHPKSFPPYLTLEGNVAVHLMKQIPRSVATALASKTRYQTPTINKARFDSTPPRKPRYDSTQPRQRAHGMTPLRKAKQDSQRRLQNVIDKTAMTRAPVDEICAACGGSGHTAENCDHVARTAQVDKYIKNRQNSRSVATAITNYNKFQQDRHAKRDFTQEISRFRDRMRKFAQNNPSFDRRSIKKIYLDSYQEEVDQEATMDIFEDVFDDEDLDESIDNDATDDDVSEEEV